MHQGFLSEDHDNVFNGAAALGFYLTLAIFPAMILLMSVIPYLPIAEVDKVIMDLLGKALPPKAFGIVEKVVNEVTRERRGGLLSFGVLATLWAVSTGMYAIMQQLNITYDVKKSRGFVRGRLTALALSLLFGVLVLGAFSLVVIGGIIEDWIGNQFDFSPMLLTIFTLSRWAIIVLALLLGLAVIYCYGPNVERPFAFITPGSMVGVGLLIAALPGFSFYSRNFADYDAAASAP
ncbi:MAG: YihY/virulence factor BrkB family protein [Rhodoplanes sp.]